ncbi:serine hydrolase domain-containing protein [Alkaliphilus peptidifermentans]|uniref:CubicO group peptidase, beta-lactamase class C family n=1 Tax=Alkaliphilus peptidifermentans DSM 18978 TaxID=1120976 RepID=A0A1G5GS47_9FIRM|nr:serine hydrolase domain-containing protein [Alkaliphilus peptidifermentans]SCY54231.1 CubicO group peptidase, beta-lactamase class C family [Alkaliphilus peptidifermentans DSM 18978]
MKLILTRLTAVIVITSLMLATACEINKKKELNTFNTEVKEEINEILSGLNFRGTILIAQGDKTYITSRGEYSDNDLMYPIGSITKVFTSVAIMKLQEDGALNLDDKLSKYIPEMKHADSITIRNLLSHRSGIPRDVLKFFDLGNNIEGSKRMYKYGSEHYSDMSRSEFNNIIVSGDFELLSDPNDRFFYSNFGYVLLGIVIERVSEKSYMEYLDEIIFKPLNIEDIGFWENSEKDKYARSIYYNEEELYATRKFGHLVTQSAGGLYATAESLLQFAKALQTNQILQSKSFEEMTTRIDGYYGLGIMIDLKGNYFHFGTFSSFSSMLKIYKETNNTIIILMNDIDSRKLSVVEDQILKVINQENQ